MTAPELTLDKAKKEAEVKTRSRRVSDFLSQDELKELRENNKKKHVKARFDAVDAFAAEVLARFGYDVYMAWKAGEFDEEKLARFVYAERAREVNRRLVLENILVAAIAGANNPTKNNTTPKGLKLALKWLGEERERTING